MATKKPGKTSKKPTKKPAALAAMARGPASGQLGTPRTLVVEEDAPWPVIVKGGFVGRDGDQLVVRDLSGAVARVLDAPGDPKSLGASLDGALLVVGDTGDRVIAVDVESGAQRWVVETQQGWVTSVAVSPDGKRVATGGEGSLVIHDATTGATLARFAEDATRYRSIAWSSDAASLVTLADNVVRVPPRRATGAYFTTWSATDLTIANRSSVAFDGNSELAIVGRRAIALPYNTIALFDLDSGAELAAAKLVERKTEWASGRNLALGPRGDLAVVLINEKPEEEDDDDPMLIIPDLAELQLWRLEPLGRLDRAPLSELHPARATAVGGVAFTPAGDAVIVRGANVTVIVPLTTNT